MGVVVQTYKEDELQESHYQSGVRYLSDIGITRVPGKYILPVSDRPESMNYNGNAETLSISLPIIDFSELQGSNRSQALHSLAKACEEFGFFQLTNHGVESDIIRSMIDVGRAFFELPLEERSKYMSTEMGSTVRCGTSFNQNTDGVFCWRDFLKVNCHPLNDVLPLWPTTPVGFREALLKYSKETKSLYLMLMEAILETLGLVETLKNERKNESLSQFDNGSQLIVVNCYPSCPEPDLTLAMAPHSDYGVLTVLLQDEVKGLQIQHQGKWIMVEPRPNSFVVNIGDHLEIFSNGKYKSVLHRVLANSSKSRLSVASLHSLPFCEVVRPSPELINEKNPRRYKDTDFASFLSHLTSGEAKKKNFLESRKIELNVGK